MAQDDLRRDLAISRLSSSRVSLVQLASELGFSDSPTFQRALDGQALRALSAALGP